MKLNEVRALLTGASGGIGSEVCKQLLDNQATVYAISRDKQKLEALFGNTNNSLSKIEADISTQSGRSEIANMLNTSNANVNVLINCAGSNQFSSISDISELDVIQQVNANLVTPILLTKSLLPMLAKQDKAKIINVGSSFDSIGFPGFSVYSATKFGLRGFSESLRRELSDTNIEIGMVSPRATNTEMNGSKVQQMNTELKVKTDSADQVAKIILQSIESSNLEKYIGWPEKLFARVNRIFPSIVDGAISKQLSVIKQYF
ncbi:MAG: SDR family oxidoreductase [Gammaproteobacteria bacterium]|nr:SDR family oxidoreductase [Gammaproteobacteria bacterium]NNC68932.1 SDR family oxidoreductase [Gammaproteobacteria bacterium]